MRIAAPQRSPDLFTLFQTVTGAEALDPALIDQILARTPPELFSGNALTGKTALGMGSLAGPPEGGIPLLQSEVGPLVGLDPRAQADLTAKAQDAQKIEALTRGPFDRTKVEEAIKDLFARLAGQGLPLEARPGSALAEAFATGDFSQLNDTELLQLLILMALYGQNRHKPNSVAQHPNAGMAPRGSWPSGGGANRAGGGNQHTGLNRPATAPAGPVPPAGEIPEGTPIGQRLAMTARQVANRMNSTGWCFKGVAQAVAQATGVQLSGRSAYMAADQLAASDRFREVRVAPNQLRDLPPGAVVVWGQTAQSPHGHISVALGNGQEASDHVQAQITSLRGASNYRVFVPN